MRLFVVAAGLLTVTGLGASLGFYLAFVRDLPDLRSVDDYRPPLGSHVLDRNGKPIGEFYVERRQLVPYERIPDHVVRAFVAGEDRTFFEHEGISYFDLLPSFREASASEPMYAMDNTHWNVPGNAHAAREIGAWLRPLLPEPAP